MRKKPNFSNIPENYKTKITIIQNIKKLAVYLSLVSTSLLLISVPFLSNRNAKKRRLKWNEKINCATKNCVE